MDEKYISAIKAGVIGGVILSVIQLISNFIPCIGCLIVPITMMGVGVLALYLGANFVTKLIDAVVISGISGAIAGVIDGIVIMLLITLGGSLYSSSISGAGASFFAGIISMLFAIVMATIFAVIAGVIYAFLVMKITK
ncbi:hypothetical protein CUJ83_12870 [Methanocella sp. CWC-04]|uniref:DUF5518 domain-containing protein n=1 Tax=Methanooceanicella nereidis TaxID=2052831 RepID=A0AAP2W701_9EURY|nr:hypothetical protein [Methanocella sp. CWC-04]MCD1295888.1 hypothetical protein [Methanocella sp. CWC-04]